MDTKASMDQLGVNENMSCDSIEILDKNCADMDAMDADFQSSPPLTLDGGDTCLSPITPYSGKESVDLMSNFASPLTVVCPLHQSGSDSSMNKDDDTPCTPRAGVFDPFAPGPEKLMLAPHCMKHVENFRSDVATRLNFNSITTNEDVSETDFEDDTVLEAVYDTLLEVIISKQAEEILAEISTLDSSPDVFTTPPFATRLTAFADTCPGAPLRPVRKSRNFDLGVCRALEFDF